MSETGHSVTPALAQHPKLMGMAYVALLFAGGTTGEWVMNSVGSGNMGP